MLRGVKVRLPLFVDEQILIFDSVDLDLDLGLVAQLNSGTIGKKRKHTEKGRTTPTTSIDAMLNQE
jgi:hypothetical protein